MSMSVVGDIFNHSIFIDAIGEIHPITMKHYDTFMNGANIITIPFSYFDVKEEYKSETKLLDLIYIYSLQSEGEERKKLYEQMTSIFSTVLKKDIEYVVDDDNGRFYFLSKNEDNEIDTIITRDNYDEIRSVIMKQNLLFEPKVFENKIKQEWAELVLANRAKNSVDMDIEDMITTVASFSGKHYWDLENYTIYQIKAEFARISKFKGFDTNLAMIGNTDKISNLHYAEKTDIHVNPYDTVFVNNSKVSKLEKSMK